MLTIRELNFVLQQPPNACAEISGTISYPNLIGLANFYTISSGVLLFVRVKGLPFSAQVCGPAFFGFHIHEGLSCTGTSASPFADVGGHYNPHNCAHAEHAGDLPPLLSSRGDALMLVLINSFTVEEVIDRTLIIHSSPVPTENPDISGPAIACGVISKGPCTTNSILFK
ncbi:MAG: superoxide dismutase family protein [Firmicutes bacterium]|nr:superoxide dismutase family protein [Bacillota bacterium]